MTRVRLNEAERIMLRGMRFTHVVYIAEDVSVEVPGSVQSAFRNAKDAHAEAKRLDSMYHPGGFAVAEV